jgi:hypothetical protein
MYFGIFCTSLFSLINLYIAYIFENKLRQSESYEMMYVWGYVLLRFVLNLTANTPTLISSTTIMLMTGGLLFKTANIFKSKNINLINKG